MSRKDATELTFPLPASVRLKGFEKMLAGYREKLIVNPLDAETAFAMRVCQGIVDALREEVGNEWPEVIDE